MLDAAAALARSLGGVRVRGRGRRPRREAAIIMALMYRRLVGASTHCWARRTPLSSSSLQAHRVGGCSAVSMVASCGSSSSKSAAAAGGRLAMVGRRGISGVAAYEAALERFGPQATKCMTGGVLAFLGDLLAQSYQCDEFDLRRLAIFTVFGVGWTGLFNHYWFGFLAAKIPGNTWPAVVSKTAVQHTFYNPVMYIPTFYVFTGVLTGLSSSEILAKAKDEYWPTLMKLWAIWVPSTLIQMAFVPVNLQVLYVAGVSFGWNVLLSVSYNVRRSCGFTHPTLCHHTCMQACAESKLTWL
jgi:hypothetical protein